jgi:hypothetical protein
MAKTAKNKGFLIEVAEGVEAAYRRGDMWEKRRRMVADWASYCTSSPEDGERRAAQGLVRLPCRFG